MPEQPLTAGIRAETVSAVASRRPDTPHLLVQLSLVASGQAAARRGSFRTKLRVGTYQFNCEVVPDEPLQPGGMAVHCAVLFDEPQEALSHFPAGGMFEVWENGRRGYGQVLSIGAA